MQIETIILKDNNWNTVKSFQNSETADLVTVFGDRDIYVNKEHFDYLRKKYPNAQIIGCSTAGNIMDDEVSSSQMVATAVKFDKARVKLETLDFEDYDKLKEDTKALVSKLEEEDLKHIFILADGLKIIGSKLLEYFNETTDVTLSGGLAGDGDRFEKTYVISNDYASEQRVAVLAFYGDSLTTSSGCYGGWSEFGANRTITKSVDNIIYEIDNKPALDLYKNYLGDYAKDLPNSGLRFPLSVKTAEGESEVIRTLLAIDENEKSIIFAGDVPQGSQARLMKPDIDALIDGAGKAAKVINNKNSKDALGLVVSCVGRKIVMSQLVDEELEAISEELGDNVQLTGFYSYGEIAPYENEIKNCKLHNQTMTLTVIYED